MGFVLGFFMLVTLIWVFASPKSYLKASMFLGFLLMFGGMIGVSVGLDEAKANLPDEIQILAVVCGGLLGFGMIITSQLTLWAADNKSVPNVKPDVGKERAAMIALGYSEKEDGTWVNRGTISSS
jgi:hypothetical protein